MPRACTACGRACSAHAAATRRLLGLGVVLAALARSLALLSAVFQWVFRSVRDSEERLPNLSVPVTVRVRRSGRRALRKSRTAVSRNAYGFIHPHPAAPAAQPHATRRVAQTKMSASPGSPIPARREGAGGGGCGAARGARAPRPWATSGAGRQPTTIAHTFILELGRYNRRNGSQTGGAVRRGVGEPVTLSSGVGRSGRHVVLERDVLVAVKVVESSSRAASRARRRRRSSRSH